MPNMDFVSFKKIFFSKKKTPHRFFTIYEITDHMPLHEQQSQFQAPPGAAVDSDDEEEDDQGRPCLPLA